MSYRRHLFRHKIGLPLQLNVYNALDNDRLAPIAAQPTGAIAAYMFPPQRRFEFTTRLSY